MTHVLRLACLVLFPLACARAEVTDVSVFARLPVLEAGRVMPMDTYARTLLLSLSGRSTAGGDPAVQWLARVFFDTARADAEAVFLINHPEVAEAIGLPAEGRKRYPFSDLLPRVPELRALAVAADRLEKGERTAVEEESLRLFDSVSRYAGVRQTFRWAQPRPDLAVEDADLRGRLGLAPEFASAPSLYRLLVARDRLDALALDQREVPVDARSPAQRTVAGLQDALATWARERPASSVALIPIPGHAPGRWVDPESLLRFGGGGETVREGIDALADLASAYARGRQVLFDIAARRFRGVVTRTAPDPTALAHVNLEVAYNRLDPLDLALWLYGLAFLAVLASLPLAGRSARVAAWSLTTLAMAANAAGIVCRMIIMGRPPVTNLYATFLFTGLVCAALGVVMELLQRNRLGLLVASLSGLALLFVSRRFAAEGDTMGVMVAVLDSNFWLATHVVCITIGYSGCLAAGVIGHVWLIQSARGRPRAELATTFEALRGMLGFGLTFSFLGTMLGGVWADQSWGRFWGWDPKENGALLIVLWSAILFHARLAGLVRERGFAAGAVAGVVCVLAAWLGVNLLGVGLHSYGFTSSLAWGFAGTCAFEAIFLAVTVPLAGPRRTRPQAAPVRPSEVLQ